MSRIKEITFTFENCEMITIPGKYIGSFCVDDVRKSVERVAMNAICEMDVCHSFCVEIHKDANVEYRACGHESNPVRKFDRFLEWNDITQIEFSLVSDETYFELEQCDASVPEDAGWEKKFSYFLDWGGGVGGECVNPYQKTVISGGGWLYIVVDKNHSMEDFFPEEEINDPSYMQAEEEFLDIGDENWSVGRDCRIIGLRRAAEEDSKEVDAIDE